MRRIGSWLYVPAIFLAATLRWARALAAQAPTFVFSTVGGSTIPNNTVYYTSEQQIKVSICHSSYLQSYSASLTNSSGWSSVTLQDGLQAECTGEGFLAEITLAPGSNTLFADATDGSWNYGSDEVTVIYVLPSHARVIAPGDGGVRVMPGTVVELPFTVVNAGSAPNSFKVTVSCTGPFSTCVGPWAKGTNYVQIATLPVSGSATVMLKATAGSATGTGQLRAIATPDGGGVADTASTPLAITSAPIPPPEVRRARDSVIVAASVSRTAQFKVTNPDPFASRTVTLSIPSGGCGTLSSCTPSPSSVSLGPQRDTTITVTFTTPGSFQTTKVVLLASASSPTHAVRDSTWVTIGNPPSATVAVNVADHNAGPSVARDQCLSVAAGPGAGIECGSLRLAHGMRGVRTLGVDRAPTLVYLSRSANPMMLIAARVSVANHVLSLPADSLKTTLTVGGVPHTRAWPWSAACASSTGCRIAVPLDAQALATGLYEYSLEVRIGSGGGAPTGTATGKLAVVNDRQSVWGAGWWLEGLERLVPMGADSVFWIGGDGSTRLYTRQSSTVFTVPASARLDRHDTLTTNGSTWARRIRNGATVAFDASYRHVSTTNRQGHQTTFYYHSTTTRLDSIEVPVPASTRRVFRFLWDATASPIKLTKILLPSQATGAPVDTFTVTLDGSRRVTALRSPGDSAVTFTYSGGSFLPLTRVDRMANPTTYTYDAFGAVTNVSLAMGGSPSIQTKLCAAETRSLVSCSIDGGQAVPVSGAREVTVLDGPRSDVVDWTRFFVNRLGAPDTIVDALGGRTRIRRDNGSFPALVTQVTDPAGLVSSTAYNSRGLPDSSVVHAPYGGANAVTKYKWNSKWDMLVSTRSPTAELDTISIDATTGNRMWQQRGTSSTRRVHFAYDGYYRLIHVRHGADTLTKLTYESALGNVWKSQTALGYTTEMLQNAIGADTVIWTPTDTNGTPALRTKQFQKFDALGRVIRTETTASAQTYKLSEIIGGSDSVTVPSKKLTVKTEYDAEGRVLSVLRFSGTDSVGATAAKSSFVYDKAGRVTSQSEWHTSGTCFFYLRPGRECGQQHVATQPDDDPVIRRTRSRRCEGHAARVVSTRPLRRLPQPRRDAVSAAQVLLRLRACARLHRPDRRRGARRQNLSSRPSSQSSGTTWPVAWCKRTIPTCACAAATTRTAR
jgi:YD repeat-containing protein